MIYIEFTSRRPQPGLRETDRGALAVKSFESQLQRFHRAVLSGTERLGGFLVRGPDDSQHGPYMAARTRARVHDGLVHADGRTRTWPDWDKVFRSGEADALEKPVPSSSRGSTGRDAMRRCWSRCGSKTGSTMPTPDRTQARRSTASASSSAALFLSTHRSTTYPPNGITAPTRINNV